MVIWNTATKACEAIGRSRSIASRTSGQRSCGRPSSSNGFQIDFRNSSVNASAT